MHAAHGCQLVAVLLVGAHVLHALNTPHSAHSIQDGSGSVRGDRSTGGAPSCAVTHAKEDCGYFGIQQAECEAKSCCWQPSQVANTPWCYMAQQPPGATYSVAQRNNTGGGGAELLLQLSQAVLPQYGPDIPQLAVLVEAQTPHRLHVKISPAGVNSRWEVPEFLIRRPGSTSFPAADAVYEVELPQLGEPFSFAVGRNRQQQQQRRQQQRQQQQRQHGQRDEQLRPVFNTSGFSLVFKDQYMELATSLLPSTSIYGLGETIHQTGQIKLPRDGKVITMWNYDIASTNTGINLYGSHPFYLQVDADGTSSGVFLLNSNGMDVILQQTSLTYRVIGGVLDFYFFLGPSPEAVIQQYQQVIGKPAMPPLWALGFHQCRWGYNTLAAVEEVVQGYRAADIPLEVMWTDIDYMDRYRDFTFDPQRFNVAELQEFVDRLHAAGQRWVPITDCGIPHAPDDPAFISGMAQDVFIKDVTGAPYLGQVWPGATHYPDFLATNRTWSWWMQQLQHMWQQVPYDGMWIDMNEASNFCDGEVCRLHPTAAAPTAPSATAAAASAANAAATAAAPGDNKPFGKPTWRLLQNIWQALLLIARKASSTKVSSAASKQAPIPVSASLANCELDCTPPAPHDSLAYPPYAINNLQNRVPLGSKALPVNARHVGGELQYDTHNLYGLSEAAATWEALVKITGKRAFVLSRSTFPGSGRYAAHWTGDNAATWDNLLWSVSGLLNSNMWGMALAGADVCGFMGDTNEELCARWISAGAFYTFTRNHNSINSPPQELYRWPAVAEAARKALGMRYSLLPYLYTSFYKAHVDGGTVARPVFFSFPDDAQAREVFKQWLLGDSILVSPVLTPATTQLQAYFPAASWYSLSDFSCIQGPKNAFLDIPLTDIAVHVRGGSIVALQQPGATTTTVRKSPVKLLVALDQHQQHQQQEKEEMQHSTAHSSNSSSIADNGGAAADTAAGATNQHHKLVRPGLSLGCGMLYMDDGESLQVPADESLLLFFSSMVLPNCSHGWLAGMSVEAADAAAAAGSSAIATPAACVAKDCSDMVASHCSTSGAWTGLGGRSSSRSKSRQDSMPTATAAGWSGTRVAAAASMEMPELAEVVFLGVQPAVAMGREPMFVVTMNGQQVPDAQVQYDSSRQVLKLGLQQQLAEDFRLEWQVVV